MARNLILFKKTSFLLPVFNFKIFGYIYIYIYVCMCVCVCVCARARACVCVCEGHSVGEPISTSTPQMI